MNKNLTEVIFILDRSGSMAGLEADTIGGFNGMIEKQKKQEGEVLVSTVLFDNWCEVIHDRVDIRQLKPMTEREYFVRGCTALLDAVGGAIRHIRNVHKYAREEDRPQKTIVVITTDGLENASHQFGYEEVRRMIAAQEEQGWEFLFLGANMDAAKEAGRFGIRAERAVDYHADGQGTDAVYSAVGEAICCMRADGEAPLSDKWRRSVDADYRKRSKKKK
ncbi:MAG: VWA domain-containing protein [Oscillospiraceae bacterium]|nr:VWA domain-containing protein [Oscillospiraceae bacterium]